MKSLRRGPPEGLVIRPVLGDAAETQLLCPVYSALTTIHLFFEQDTAKLLGIPDDVMRVAMLPVSYTQGTDFKIAKRPGPETITFFDSWGH